MTKFGKLFKFPQKTGDRNQDLYSNNLFYLTILSIFRSMYFMVPVWVSMELKYISLTQVAVIDMVILMSGLLLELPTGALADLIGRKKSVAVSFFASSIGYILFAYANSFHGFLIAGLTFGLGDALLSGALEALVFDSLKQNHREHEFSEINNRNQLIFNYSIVVAIIIGGFVYENHYQLPSLLTSIALFISGIISLKFIEPDVDSEKFTLRNYLIQTKLGFKELFKTKQARDMSLFYVLVGAITWPIILTFKNFALVDLSVSEKNMGLILAVLSVAAVQFLHFLIKKKIFENTDVVFLMPAIVLSIFLPISYFYNVPAMMVIIFFCFVISSMRWNIIGGLTHRCYSSKNRATAISSLSMIISLSYVLVLGLFSLINDRVDQSIRVVFLFLAALSILFLLPISIKLRNKYHSKEITSNG